MRRASSADCAGQDRVSDFRVIRRVTGRNRYTLTTDGLRFAIFCRKVHNRIRRPLTATDHQPPEIRAALRTIDRAIDERPNQARLPTT